MLFGGTLLALQKKTGGLHPIDIGYYWRRLTSKCANKYASNKAAAYLSSKQLGVGVPGGCEAATRTFLANMYDGDIVVKLDLSIAFNSLYRDRMLASVYDSGAQSPARGPHPARDELSCGPPSQHKKIPYVALGAHHREGPDLLSGGTGKRDKKKTLLG